LNSVFFTVIDWLADLIGLPLDLVGFGHSQFMFWQAWT
jgi:hypothetical protein